MSIVVFLQNAWSPLYAGREWPRASWLRALSRSRSGQRLRLFIDDLNLVENTTPICGGTPDSVVSPDYGHIADILEKRCPEVVVTCGRQALDAILKFRRYAPILALPHPAHRTVQNSLFLEAKRLLGAPNRCGRIKLIPLRPPREWEVAAL